MIINTMVIQEKCTYFGTILLVIGNVMQIRGRKHVVPILVRNSTPNVASVRLQHAVSFTEAEADHAIVVPASRFGVDPSASANANATGQTLHM